MSKKEFVFTEEQEKAIEFLTYHFDEMKHRDWYHHITLSGYAGTGKSTIIQEFIKKNNIEAVQLTATTNKAANELKRKNKEAGLSNGSRTIYSLLGLVPSDQNEFKEVVRLREECIKPGTVVVIDECSMIGELLYGYILEHLKEQLVIFIGDPKQIPPVNNNGISKSFQCEHNFALTEIIRQKKGNNILQMTKVLRDMMDAPNLDWSEFEKLRCVKNSNIHDMYNVSPNKLLRDRFDSNEFKLDNDSFRYLCWTNAKVDQINRLVRSYVYGDDADPYIVGERLVVQESYSRLEGDNEVPVFHSSEEVIVREAFERIGYMDIPCTVLELSGKTKHCDVYVPTQQGMIKYNTILEGLRKKAAITGAWYEVHGFTKKFCRVQPVYAITTHRAQGSTYGSVYVDLVDIGKNKNIPEMLSLLYVACSRPRFDLFI